MILDYAEDGSLRDYLDKNYGCLDSDPLKRPKAEEIEIILYTWLCKPSDKQTVVLRTQIEEADNINNNSPNITIPSTSLGFSYETRSLNFNNLPEPKNSDDYYEQNDNIISKEFSDSLEYCRIDIPCDYYEKIDNIISKEFSDTLEYCRIDIS
ncbi:uncharacterized protein OCT59_016997 [Rhizophagus irregularis]|uniref:uncharacterized protein n=1 Tax=Rhizophagus irregularis TaxID=588596 RepID=UPI003322503A|nr:hypothetical protein OCT59_016997 [Rhizophagus irregularis]